MAIINQNAVGKHVRNINLKNAIRKVSDSSKLDLQIVLTPEQEAQFIDAQTSKKQLNFEHILIAARNTNGKSVDLDNPQLIKTLSNVAAKFKGEIVYINGFLQTKDAKELPEIRTVKTINLPQQAKAEKPKVEQEKAEQPQREQLEIVENQPEAEQPETPEAEPKKAAKAAKK